MWPFRRGSAPRSLLTVSDPAVAGWFAFGPSNYSGVQVTETAALGLSSVWRAVQVIAGTLATLPFRTMHDRPGADPGRQQVASVFDDPGAHIGLSPFNWKQTVAAFLALHGEAFLAHVYNGAGGLAGLTPVHPLRVSVDWERRDGRVTGRKVFTTTTDGVATQYTDRTMTQIMGLSLDGLRGLSPVSVARNSLGTSIAGDRSAARTFSEGAMTSGVLTPEEDVTAEEATQISADLNAKITGWENAGRVAVVNRKLKFTPWTMSLADAQFLQSRQFQVEEVARWFGIPPHLLMQTEKQTSWGTGVAEQNRGLGRFTLVHYSAPIEETCSTLLPAGRWTEFDYAGLERPTPEQEISLLIQQVGAGLMTPNEARKIRNMPPIENGDILRIPRSGEHGLPGFDEGDGEAQ